MKILLLNDNPVVRKLVALSAQKTKDDLNVIWSVDEVKSDDYDLLIVDDAHYSDEAMSLLREKIHYKASLLMATRGNATPAGFDKVINKPFLPTDLVELFSQIAKDISPSVQEIVEPQTSDTKKAIVLDITNLDDDLNLDDFDIGDEENDFEAKTNVLDHEEVQELQELLDEADDFDIDDELLLDASMEEEIEETAISDEDLLNSLDDLMSMEEEEVPELQMPEVADEVDDLDALLLEGLEGLDEDEEGLSEKIADDLLSDDEFVELEQQIQVAVEGLGIEDLELGIDDIDMGDFASLEDLDGLSERDIKLAIGEEVEEEEVRIGHGSHASLDTEALSEAMGDSTATEMDDELEDLDSDVETALAPRLENHSTPAEGMDALQALLRALSNADVAKTLKGLSINININFGNDK